MPETAFYAAIVTPTKLIKFDYWVEKLIILPAGAVVPVGHYQDFKVEATHFDPSTGDAEVHCVDLHLEDDAVHQIMDGAGTVGWNVNTTLRKK